MRTGARSIRRRARVRRRDVGRALARNMSSGEADKEALARRQEQKEYIAAVLPLRDNNAFRFKYFIRMAVVVTCVVLVFPTMGRFDAAKTVVEQYIDQPNSDDVRPCYIATPSFGELTRGLDGGDLLWTDYVGSDSGGGWGRLRDMICAVPDSRIYAGSCDESCAKDHFLHSVLSDVALGDINGLSAAQRAKFLDAEVCNSPGLDNSNSFTKEDEEYRRSIDLFGDPKERIFRAYISSHAGFYNAVYNRDKDETKCSLSDTSQGMWGPFRTEDPDGDGRGVCGRGAEIRGELMKGAVEELVQRTPSGGAAPAVPSTRDQLYRLYALAVMSAWDDATADHGGNAGKCFRNSFAQNVDGSTEATAREACYAVYTAPDAPATPAYLEKVDVPSDSIDTKGKPIPHYVTVAVKQPRCNGAPPVSKHLKAMYDAGDDQRPNHGDWNSSAVETCVATHTLRLADQRRLFGVPDVLGDFVGGLGEGEFGTSLAGMLYEPSFKDNGLHTRSNGVSAASYALYRLGAATMYAMLTLSVACFFIGHMVYGLVYYLLSAKPDWFTTINYGSVAASKDASAKQRQKLMEDKRDAKSPVGGFLGAGAALVATVYTFMADPVVHLSPHYTQTHCDAGLDLRYQSVWPTTETNTKLETSDVVPWLLVTVLVLWIIAKGVNIFMKYTKDSGKKGIRVKSGMIGNLLVVGTFLAVLFLQGIFVARAGWLGNEQWKNRVGGMVAGVYRTTGDNDPVREGAKSVVNACADAVSIAVLSSLFFGLTTDLGRSTTRTVDGSRSWAGIAMVGLCAGLIAIMALGFVVTEVSYTDGAFALAILPWFGIFFCALGLLWKLHSVGFLTGNSVSTTSGPLGMGKADGGSAAAKFNPSHKLPAMYRLTVNSDC